MYGRGDGYGENQDRALKKFPQGGNKPVGTLVLVSRWGSGVRVGGGELEHHVQAEASGLRKSRGSGVINLTKLHCAKMRELQGAAVPEDICTFKGQLVTQVHEQNVQDRLPVSFTGPGRSHFCPGTSSWYPFLL